MGELYIGGAGVARGYLDRPELTHERFLPDRFSGRAGALLYKTGDLVRSRPDGVLEFLGRVDDQVKVRGYRIELGEIEAAVASHPAVQSSAVLARDDGSGNKQLVGYVVVRDGHQLSSEIAQEFLKRQLPEYMVPAHFVFLESLPLTINGKVDRRALSALSEARDQSARNVVAPRNAIELAIASIWAELLKVETISVEDDFFDLGGHSLLAIRVLAQIRDRLDVDLDTQALFENSTLESLATLVAEAKGETPEVIRIPSRHDDDTLVASFAQEPLWILDQLVPNSPAYNIVDFIPFVGSVDVHALTKSLHELLVRHEVLRTAFERIDGQLMQIISPSCELDLTEIDLRSAPESELQNEWLKAVHEQGRKVFDLAKAPLVRACMVRVSATEHRLLIVIHHIIADEWSMEVIQEELRALYAAHSTGRLSPLRPLAIQYADYALWQRAWLQGAVLEDQIEYWKSELKGAMPVLALPTDKPRPASPTFRGACELFTISKATLASLQSLARREQATPFMLLEAAFASLLYRYTGQDDILIGTPISGRKYTETQGLVGCFLNSVVLRNQFSDATTFTELLRQVRVRALGAHAHSDLPFERLVVELSPERDQGRTPLFQVMFILHSRDGVSQVSKVSGNYELETGTSKRDLSLVLSESEVGIEGLIEYSTGLFQSDTIRRLSRSYVRLLEEVVSNPERSIARIPMVADLDREQLVVEWNRTSLEFDESNLCLHEMISLHAAKTPDRIALVFEGQEMSYSQLEQRSNQLANYLIGLGVVPDMLVGLLVERSLDMVVGLLGILKAGGAYVPLDPSFPPDRLRYVIEDAQMRVVITHRGLDATQKILPETVVHLDRDWEMIAKATGAASLSNKPNLESLAYVLYTSGSTGMPKGVAIPHAAIVNFLASMRNEPGMRASDVLLAITTLSFDIAGLELYLPLISGAKVVIASRDEVIDPDRLAKKLGDCGCTYLQATPATWRALIDAGWEGSTNLKALCGGEAMPPDLAQALLSRCAELWNMYGPTETTVWSTIHRVTVADTIPPIGRPIANTQVYLLDGHTALVPLGAVGELYIGGRGLARGYVRREELTREHFVPNPFVPNTLIYRTGDLARWRADGRLECLGRTDHQVKLRGYRIELGEIEANIKRHPDIRNAVVMAREDKPGEKQLIAYVVANSQAGDLLDELRARLRAAVPDYMVPAHFVMLDVLPLTPNGKIDRNALPAPNADDVSVRSDTYVAPGSDFERRLTSVWQEVLEIGHLGVNDNFFDIGGYSLLAIKLMGRITQTFGKRLPLTVLFEAPTIRQLAKHVEDTENKDGPHSLVPLQASGTRAPLYWIPGGAAIGIFSFSQHITSQLGTDQPLYALSSAFPTRASDIESVEKRADRYLRLIRKQQPHGPYHFIGFCAGGTIAFEMAQQLLRDGEETALLSMIDCWCPAFAWGLLNKLRFKAQRLQYQLREAREKRKSLLAFGREKLLTRRANQADLAEVASAVQKAKRDGFVDNETQDFRVITRATRDVVEQYTPRHYPGLIVMYITEDPWLQGISHNVDPRFAWTQYAAAHEVYTLTGGHQTVLELPHVLRLGQVLNESLQKAFGSHSGRNVAVQPTVPELV